MADADADGLSDEEFFDACSDVSSDEDPIEDEGQPKTLESPQRPSLDVGRPSDPALASPPELIASAAPLSSLDSSQMLQALVQAKGVDPEVTTEDGTLARPPSEEAPVAPPRRRKKKGATADAADSGEKSGESSAAAATAAEEAHSRRASTTRKLPATPGSSPPARLHRQPTPTDEEILNQVFIKCLDTGETMPLAKAEEILPPGLNPLALQVMQRTKEFSTQDGHDELGEGQEEGPGAEAKKRLKQFFGKARDKMRAVADGASGGDRKEGKVKAAPSLSLALRQDLSREHMGAIWTMKFSACGRLLATAGQDQVVRVWVVKEAHDYFLKLREESGQQHPRPPTASFPTAAWRAPVDEDVFLPTPFAEYFGHAADVLDLSWSSLENNFFLLSSSMDKTVRLWHIARTECLACFLHEDFVTAIAFHPRNDKFFLSGSLDSKLRLWNIPEKKVALWNQVGGEGSNLITAAGFCRGGQMAVAGTYDGRCVFFNTEERLKYHTQIHVRSTRGKNAKGRKISGIESMPDGKIIVTSNDSRVRLYDLKDLSLSCKYKGCQNNSSQITAGMSHDGRYIVCGSEDHNILIWDVEPKQIPNARRWRRDRNDEHQTIQAHDAVVTVAQFAPKSFAKSGSKALEPAAGQAGNVPPAYLLVSADFSGSINVHVARE